MVTFPPPPLHINNLNTYITNRTDCLWASGGVAILARSEYPSSQVPVSIAISVQLETKITLFNI